MTDKNYFSDEIILFAQDKIQYLKEIEQNLELLKSKKTFLINKMKTLSSNNRTASLFTLDLLDFLIITQIRLVNFIETLIDRTNNKDIIVTSLVTRQLIEQLGILSEVRKQCDKGLDKDNIPLLKRLTTTGRFNVGKFMQTIENGLNILPIVKMDKDYLNPDKDDMQINVLTLINKREESEGITFLYYFLSEFIHPNYSAIKAFMDFDEITPKDYAKWVRSLWPVYSLLIKLIILEFEMLCEHVK